MRPRHFRFTIRSMMIAVLVVAILLSLPIDVLIFLVIYPTILAVMFFCACRMSIIFPGRRERTGAGRRRMVEGVDWK
jgi:hypothetical protein